jgi:hypothetical protein
VASDLRVVGNAHGVIIVVCVTARQVTIECCVIAIVDIAAANERRRTCGRFDEVGVAIDLDTWAAAAARCSHILLIVSRSSWPPPHV